MTAEKHMITKQKKHNPKIAIIAGCWNVEDYLDAFIQSLLCQTYKNFEIILVEDGSIDNTKKIVRKYEKENPENKVRAFYNGVNRGLGHVRNVGLSNLSADTDLVACIDVDDPPPSNFLEEMVKTMNNKSADVTVCDILLGHDDASCNVRVPAFVGRANRSGFMNTGMMASACNKLFKKEVFFGLDFIEGIQNEDVPTILPIMSKFKVVYCPDTYYYYYQRAGSLQNSDITKKRFDMFRAVDIARQRMGNAVSKDIWDRIVYHQLMILLTYVIPKQPNLKKREELIKEFYELILPYDPLSNLCYQESLTKGNLLFRSYAKRLYKLLMKKDFSRVNNLMSSINKMNRMLSNRWVKKAIFSVKHPKTAIRLMRNAVLRKNTIVKQKVIIGDIISAAKTQKNKKGGKNVSVVVPNYNYGKFLYQRIHSILNQKTKIGELILLDDVSSDNSVALMKTIAEKIRPFVDVRLVVNDKNRGVFRQWEKGFGLAKYEFVWIAEADDYSDKGFLSMALMPLNTNENVVISYVDTAYMTEDGWLTKSVKSDIDIQKSHHWNRSYINDGNNEIRKYSFLNNTIANVSSVVFRKKSNIDYSKLFAKARNYKQAGDWVFYTNYMTYGDVAYTNKTLNYYRVHGSNVSSTVKKEAHLAEIKKIHDSFVRKHKLGKWHIDKMAKRRRMLKKAWKLQSTTD